MFEKYGIHATWATVGFLFAKNKEQLNDFCPDFKPTYTNSTLSYYHLIENNLIGNDEGDDPYHYAFSMIQKIIDTPGQELATHTFSHYYCNEKGQTEQQFDHDLKSAQKLSKENFNLELKSLVFPRNQFNQAYADIAYRNGIKVVRSNPNVWFWKSNFRFAFLARAIDTLFPISNTLAFEKNDSSKDNVLLLPASRFLRPFREKEKMIQKIKLRRILNEMTFAAKNKKGYHLWWHPHNFGYSLNENLEALELILKHYQKLNSQYGFSSKSMIEMY
ncbi:polysaccharide deacetylase family protein [Flavobacterium sp. SUN046]|uniref:polysaccharide deacetylase family protein n=1 Tax=Flavobacterium sp. SUN046 TaxID=3002440 RepID=UPI002DB84434|nr:polysaccharide deacetylase family protein [Flavobacterium sp. SUN046]MEC4050889.1 polysaccharide deacetylase family protein [Flavobacterium sp. SUN046]